MQYSIGILRLNEICSLRSFAITHLLIFAFNIWFGSFKWWILRTLNFCAVSRPAKHDFRKKANQIDFYRKFHIIFWYGEDMWPTFYWSVKPIKSIHVLMQYNEIQFEQVMLRSMKSISLHIGTSVIIQYLAKQVSIVLLTWFRPSNDIFWEAWIS